MIEFPLHDMASAPAGGGPLLEMVEKKFGFAPNLIRKLVEAPPAAEAYLTLAGLFDQTSLSAIERQLVLLSVSFENECTYCMAAHSGIAKSVKMPDDVLAALREGRPLADARLEVLRAFAVAVVEKRGRLHEADLELFLAGGYERRHVFEVILGVTMKTLSNYTNHVVNTPVDDAFQAHAWLPPRREAAG